MDVEVADSNQTQSQYRQTGKQRIDQEISLSVALTAFLQNIF